MKIRLLLWVLILTFAADTAYAQTVVVSDDSTNLTGNASAVLDLKSVTKGLLAPRMTEAQKNAISSPGTGLLVYQTDNTPGFYFYNGSTWVSIAYGGGGASQWTTASSDIYYNIGKVGVGTSSPSSTLHVKQATPTTGSVTVSTIEGVQNAGVGNIVISQLLNSSATSSKTGLLMGGSTAAKQWMLGTDSAGNNGQSFYLYDFNADASRLYINSSGNLGLGNTAPTERLHISGNMRITGAFMPNNSAGTSGYVLTSAGAGAAPTWTDPNSYIAAGWQLDGNTLSSLKKFGTLSFHDIPIVTNNVEKMRIMADGKVGIGKNNPTETLDVVGNMRLSGAFMPNNAAGTSGYFLTSAGTNAPPTWTDPATLAWKPDGNTYSTTKTFGTNSSHDVPFITAGSEKMRIMTSGRVGIGTATPGEILDVVGNVRFSGALMPNNAPGTSGLFLTSAGAGTAPTWTEAWKPDGNTITGTKSIGTVSFTDLPIITNNVEKLRIKADGKVGIGNSSPAEILDVTGNVKFSGALMPNNAAGTAGYFLTSAGTNAPPTWTDPSLLAWKPNGNTFFAEKSFGTVSYHDLPFITANSEKMRILADGKVGIGTATPTQALDVVGAVKFSNALMPNNLPGSAGEFLMSAGASTVPTWGVAWKPGGNTLTGDQNFGPLSYHNLPFITAGTEKMRITAAGNVGINNNSPSQALDVTGNVRFSGALMPNNAPGSTGAFLQSAGAGNVPVWADAWKPGGNDMNTSGTQNMGTTTYHPLPLIANNAEVMRIHADGNVSIGNTTSSEKLNITGNMRLSGAFMPNNSAGTAGYLLTSGGSNNPPTWVSVASVAAPAAGSTSITTLGTVTAGTWQGSIVQPAYGGTGINNGSNTLTLAGNLATSGANALTLTTTGATNVTLPTTGTLVNSAVATLSSLTSVGTIGTGTWQAGVVQPTYGGTGVNNGSKTITLGNNLATSGNFALTLTQTGTTNVTLPTSGTLATTAATTLSSLSSIGTITTGVWNGTLVSPTYGGTGVNNGSNTLTLAGSLATSGANALTLTTTGATNVTLPTSGTLLSTANVVTAAQGGTGVNNGSSTLTLAGSVTTTGANTLALATTGATSVTLPTSGTLLSTAAAVTATQGGTGQTTWTLGELPYANGANTIGKVSGNTTSGKMFLSQTGTGSVSAAPIWETVDAVDVPGALINIQRLTSTSAATYTPTTGTTRIIVHMVGGGGGGGGVTGQASRIGAGGGGGGGAYLMLDLTGVTGTYSYTCGVGGTAGANTGTNGGNGGTTLFASSAYQAPGGTGGTGQITNNSLAIAGGGAGGAVSTGANTEVLSGGSPGTGGLRLSGTVGQSGNGGPSLFGGGGDGLSSAAAGNNGTGYGGGGSGALSTAATGFAGGVGSQGVIIIYEYR